MERRGLTLALCPSTGDNRAIQLSHLVSAGTDPTPPSVASIRSTRYGWICTNVGNHECKPRSDHSLMSSYATDSHLSTYGRPRSRLPDQILSTCPGLGSSETTPSTLGR